MTKILVVEDEKPHRRFIRDVLRLAGYEVIEASDGKEALRILDRETVDLVTLDQEMPEMTGLECYESLPEDIPVVFITVFGHNPEFAVHRRKGIPVLVKPLDRRDILKAVEAALKTRR